MKTETPSIVYRSVKCLNCGDILVSRHRHDYVTCSCTKLSVDGGFDYFRINSENIKYVSVYSVSENDSFKHVREHIEWGSKGSDGNDPLKYIKLKDMEASHIEKLKEYIEKNKIEPSNKIHLFLDRELQYRKDNNI